MELENFYIIGISHKVNGDGNFKRKNLKKRAEKAFSEDKILGYLSLVTCLREEIYIHSVKAIDIDKLNEQGLYVYKGNSAISYLFKVICGLDSIIKGEDQILSQIRTSYKETLDNKHSTNILNRIFHKAIELGKEFRNLSKIGEKALSLEANSINLLKENNEEIEGKNILIIGAGELNKGIINILQKEEGCRITLVNRSKERALEVSKNYKIHKVGDYEKRYEYLEGADLIISATSALNYVLEKQLFNNKSRVLKGNKKTYLDLAVPRDIDEDIIRNNDSLYNLDDVWRLHRKNSRSRDEAEKKYIYLLDQKLEDIIKWSKYREKIEKACKKIILKNR